jgi:transposase
MLAGMEASHPMARPYSLDLRERVVAAVEKGGLSSRKAAMQFGVGVSTAIRSVGRLRKTGSVAPGKMGGHKPKAIAGKHRAWLLRRVKERGGGARARAPARAFGAQSRKARDVLYLGRGTNYPIALERALKLKQIAYIHAEGCAAGELKHGPITLIDRCRATSSRPTTACSKKVSNMQEVAARDGKIILSSDPKGAHEARVDSLCKLTLPAMPTTVIRLSYCRGDGQRRRPAAKPCQVGHRGMIEGSAS